MSSTRKSSDASMRNSSFAPTLASENYMLDEVGTDVLSDEDQSPCDESRMNLDLREFYQDFKTPRISCMRLEYTRIPETGEYKQLGSGSFGNVFHGAYYEQDDCPQEVAIKLYKSKKNSHAELSTEWHKELRNELRTELCILERFDSPYIIKAIGFCAEIHLGEPVYGVVTEFMPKGSLESLLCKEEKLDDKRKIEITLDIAFGLVDLHKKDVLHRDVKPANILLDENYRVKLADFNTAVEKKEAKKTYAVGTRGWMAPEMIHEGKDISEKCDIYSFGMLFIYIAIGHKAFYSTFSSDMFKEISKTLDSIQQVIERLKKEKYRDRFVSLMSRCLQEDAEKRPGANEIARELKEELQALQVSETTLKPR